MLLYYSLDKRWFYCYRCVAHIIFLRSMLWHILPVCPTLAICRHPWHLARIFYGLWVWGHKSPRKQNFEFQRMRRGAPPTTYPGRSGRAVSRFSKSYSSGTAGPRRWHLGLARIFYGSGERGQFLWSRILNFCACAARHRPQILSVWSQVFQNPTAPARLGRRQRHLAYKGLGKYSRSVRSTIFGLGTRSRIFSFGTCAARHHPQLNPAAFTHSDSVYTQYFAAAERRQASRHATPYFTCEKKITAKNLTRGNSQLHIRQTSQTEREMSQPDRALWPVRYTHLSREMTNK